MSTVTAFKPNDDIAHLGQAACLSAFRGLAIYARPKLGGEFITQTPHVNEF
jgi:hypothetical protein